MALYEEWEVLSEVGLLCSNGNDEKWGIWLKGMRHVEFLAVKGGTWKSIWELVVPNKICFFIWKACKKTLAVRHNLEKRRIRVVNKYEFCGEADETEGHIFFGCELSMCFCLRRHCQLI